MTAWQPCFASAITEGNTYAMHVNGTKVRETFEVLGVVVHTPLYGPKRYTVGANAEDGRTGKLFFGAHDVVFLRVPDGTVHIPRQTVNKER